MQWSNPVKLKGAAIFSKVIGENTDGIYLLRYRNRFYSKNVILERYNHRLAFEFNETIDLNNARLVKIVLTQKGILLIQSKYNKENQSNQLSGQYYNFDFKPIGESKILAETTVKVYGDRGNYRIRVSDDQQNLSLLYTQKSTNNEFILFHKLFRVNSLEETGYRNYLFPINYNDFIIKDFLVNNKGEVSFLIKRLTRQKRKISSSSYSLYTLRDSTLNDYVLSDTTVFKSTKLFYDRQADKAKVLAFYGYENALGIDGMALFYKPDTSAVLNEIKSAFSPKFIEEANVKDRANGSISEGFEMVKVVPRSDGGFICVAEQKEIATEDDVILVNGIAQSTSKNIYNFNELLVLNYNASGAMDWHRVIKKNQTTINDGGYYSSAVVYVGSKFLQIIYNDQLRSSGEVVKYTIYNNGTIESAKLLKNELDYVAVIPIEAKQVSSNKVIIPTSKNRRFALLKIIYD